MLGEQITRGLSVSEPSLNEVKDPGGERDEMFVSPRSFHAEFHPHRRSTAGPEIERRVVLLGRAGAGKSASANTLFGRHVFLEARWGRFHTTECQRGFVSRFGRRLEILDTPGFLLDADINNPKVKREFAKLIGISSPGPHVFCFVFPTPHMHRCDVEIFQKFIYVFGQEVLNHTILLFSKVDDLDYFSLTKQAFILSAPPEWKAIMKACNYRCVWFQNRSPAVDKELMVRTFVETMENTVNHNLGQYFCNDLYWTVEKSIIERDITKSDQNTKLAKLRRKLRVNLDAGIRLIHGDTRKDPNRTREDFRNDLINNKLKLIDIVWGTIRYFNCVKVLHIPKHLSEHHHDTSADGFDLDLQKTDRSLGDDDVKRHTTTAQPKEVRKRGRLPKIDRIPKTERIERPPKLIPSYGPHPQTDRTHDSRTRLPRLTPRNR